MFRWRKMLNSTGLVWIYSCLSVSWKRSVWCNWNVSPAVKFAGQHQVPSHVRSQLSHTCHSLTNDSWLSFFFKCNLMRHSSKRIEWLVHVDTTQLDLNREFKLFSVQLPHAGNSGETIYEVKPLEQPSQETEVILDRNVDEKVGKSPACGSSLRIYFVFVVRSMKWLEIFEIICIASLWMGCGEGTVRGKCLAQENNTMSPARARSQAPVVQRLDNAIHRINRYPADKC